LLKIILPACPVILPSDTVGLLPRLSIAGSSTVGKDCLVPFGNSTVNDYL
jgi:hypothetical protein